ncbi:hypothetical protein MIR68_007554 [Amoeboaphelidium protococcarum]|nr:hypothetical protein MIR68_007554 [Amoeboaphelidium protococcarum]
MEPVSQKQRASLQEDKLEVECKSDQTHTEMEVQEQLTDLNLRRGSLEGQLYQNIDNPVRESRASSIVSNGPSPYLVSPTGIISHKAIRQTLSEQNKERPDDTGIGSGRIRHYAQQSPYQLEWKRHEKHFFLFSSAGKPVYSRYGDENLLACLVGLLQVIIATYQEDDDQIKSIQCNGMKVVFLLRGPLYYVLVSRTDEPEVALREQLLWLHYQIVSITTTTQLTRIFKQHPNFDLRRLLGGTEAFLDHLCESVGFDPCYVFNAVKTLKMSDQLRQVVGNGLLNGIKSAMKNSQSGSGGFQLLYGMLIVGRQLITILRPSKHSFHPSDLHLIINMVNSSTSFKTSPESWMPICLPKFTDQSFLHAYISYITPNYPPPSSNLCLILVSSDATDFHRMSECKQKIVNELSQSGSLYLLQDAVRRSDYDINAVQVHGLRHFIYKSKQNIQYTMPRFEQPYKDNYVEQRRIMRLYQSMRCSMTSVQNQDKVQFAVTEHESIYGWITPSFELFALFGPFVTKGNAHNAVNSLLKWIKTEENSLFIVNAPTL